MSEVKTDLNSFESKLDLNNLDKSNWKTYRFDEIAKNISERVDPNNTDLKVYIGLEHIDSESLHIKRHGTPDDVNGTKLKFYKGDIIFGRRRAYQRKAGIATWDGFCSAHALVLRANPDVIYPELFPFFLHSDLFMNRAIDISVGSLSPTINWGTLKHQEFLLPPKEIQIEIASLLKSLESVIDSNNKVMSANTAWQNVEKDHLIQANLQFKKVAELKETELPAGWVIKPLSEYCDVIDPHPSHRAPKVDHDGLPFVGIGDVDIHGNIDLTKVRKISKADVDKQRNTFAFELGDIGFGRVATIGKVVWLKKQTYDYAVSPTMSIIKPKKQNPGFVYELLQSSYIKTQYERMITGSTRRSVGIQKLRTIQVLWPTESKQAELSKQFKQINDNTRNLSLKLESTLQLKNSIINKVF